jgi:ribosomal peptide maturation radical SAM protein 1
MRTGELFGEWLWSVAAFGRRLNEREYLDACPGAAQNCLDLGMTFEQVCALRDDTLPEIVDRWAEATDWGKYEIIGFTSTFEQHTAALALSRRISHRWPKVTVVFGGANLDDEMGPEHLRACPWIDYVVIGEGDLTFPALVARVAAGETAAGLPGVAGRVEGAVVVTGDGPRVRSLDDLPDPDYADYFDALFRVGRVPVLANGRPRLLFESSRGCWWGQKHHCTFCGLNNNGMAYRSKTPQLVLEQLRRLSDRYLIANFEAVDNIIDMHYVQELCQPLIEDRVDYHLFYEVKANLTRSQLKTLSRAGVKSIQPGIESLSTNVLSLMRKGTTMLRNVRLLKWARYYGVHVSWNMLTGFPGESVSDYKHQVDLIPLLHHLQPPVGCGRVWLERFSPFFFDETFPVSGARPIAAYRHIYPEDQFDLSKIAYFFDYEMADTVAPHELEPFSTAVAGWRESWQQPSTPILVYQRAPDWLQIVDRRDPTDPRVHALRGADAAAYEFCGDTDHSARRVCEHLGQVGVGDLTAAQTQTLLTRLCEQGLMVSEEDHFLALAIPANPNW